MIELSRTQDEECGDGTTSVIILVFLPFSSHPSIRFCLRSLGPPSYFIHPSTHFSLPPPSPPSLSPSNTTLTSPSSKTAGEILAQSLSQLERDIHPVVIISAYNKALAEALRIVKSISVPIDTSSTFFYSPPLSFLPALPSLRVFRRQFRTSLRVPFSGFPAVHDVGPCNGRRRCRFRRGRTTLFRSSIAPTPSSSFLPSPPSILCFLPLPLSLPHFSSFLSSPSSFAPLTLLTYR
ncbi:hypothetical protein NMY22_g15723 [Coprinellus aureogranulatus]|nr:hypothetical protein NMY22_g15723 [Coprinellus aureogranulatus]